MVDLDVNHVIDFFLKLPAYFIYGQTCCGCFCLDKTNQPLSIVHYNINTYITVT